ncbi:hypothetical protein LSH36_82g04009 [Paralvinella palmiformis]|uniref:Beta-galactosidase n=1 Tax=Paralvinella palmiformis TaxID=53620 RepID=A0AAD9K1Q2_9ANNE|nr:hypothetical protein LSH36_82g04009 [Paralvinella palmiformis]
MTMIPLHSFGLVLTSSLLLGGWSSPCICLCGNIVWVSCLFQFVYTHEDPPVGTNGHRYPFQRFFGLSSPSGRRNFSIDYEHDTFIKDGKPFRYISGSIHYSRIPFPYWQDRLRKMHAAGLDAIQVYVPWNVHQPQYDEFDFEGQSDLVRFIKLADQIGLLVILRAGPYICAEWEYGGFPYWLKQANQSMILRSMDPGYMKPVMKWFSVLLPKIKPFLYQNGGPIIMVQIENEYGSYRGVSCDHEYMVYLREMFHYYLGKEVVLFTTDGSGVDYLKCGTVDGVYATVDFGPGNARQGFDPMKKWNPEGPLVNSEYYTGWLDYWGQKWNYVPTTTVIKTMRDMLDMGASVNLYMFEGGTNFGYMNGADPVYKPVVTSYGYDAPLTEAGDTTDKYMAIRTLISKYKVVPPNIPPNVTTEDYGIVHMKKMASIIKALSVVSHQGCIETTYPITMEQARQPCGYVLYRAVLTRDIENAILDLNVVRDRGYVMLNEISVGMVYRNSPPMTVNITGRKGQKLDILVENMGRINYGAEINENQKGLVGNVTLDKTILTSWQYCNINLEHVFNSANVLHNISSISSDLMTTPTFYQGSFVLNIGQVPADTYLNMCGWNKGQALINGFNVGRYWPTAGPQVTLYVPGILIKPYPEVNVVVLFELMGAPSGCHGDGQGDQTRCDIRLEKESIMGAKCVGNGDIVTLRSASKNMSVNGWKWMDQKQLVK